MEELPEKTKRSYASQRDSIKKYLKNRYENDEEYRNKVNKRKSEKSKNMYNTNEEYRLRHLEKMKEYHMRKKNENIDNLIKDFENDMRKPNNIDDMKSLIKRYEKIQKLRKCYLYDVSQSIT